ncbi:MAG TPA: copper resistance protein NlpE N-terminal domain-containing protein [Burkholderiaceae bacterium]|nr:copper resistance protein NlpE N-terminal domain-containing protein [Burkholderiaceae bacterium]
MDQRWMRAAVLAAAAWLSGCATGPQGTQAPPPGTLRYAGTLPCTDCPGLHTELWLYRQPDGSPGGYRLVQRPLGVAQTGALESRGQWVAGTGAADDPQAVVIQMDPAEPARLRSFRQAGPWVLRALDSQLRELPAAWPRSLVRVPDEVPPGALVLTLGDRVARHDVRPGQEIVLLLPSQPARGYRWRVLDLPGGLRSSGAGGHVPDPAMAPPGGGFDVVRLQAAGAGLMDLRVQYASDAGQVLETVLFELQSR